MTAYHTWNWKQFVKLIRMYVLHTNALSFKDVQIKLCIP